jgi:hypothetical protein
VETRDLPDFHDELPSKITSRPPSRSSIASSRPSSRAQQPPEPPPSDLNAFVTPSSPDPASLSLVLNPDDKEQKYIMSLHGSPRTQPRDPDSPLDDHHHLNPDQAYELAVPDATIASQGLSSRSSNSDDAMSISPLDTTPPNLAFFSEDLEAKLSDPLANLPERESLNSPPTALNEVLDVRDHLPPEVIIKQGEKDIDMQSPVLLPAPLPNDEKQQDSAMDVDGCVTLNDIPADTIITEAAVTVSVPVMEDEKQSIEHHPAAPLDHKAEPIDLTLDDIPPMSDATSVNDALRVVVMRRLLFDRQTREERVEPILMANISLSVESKSACASPATRLTEYRPTQDMDSLATLRPSLAARFAERQATLEAKTQRLREEYLDLHERWVAHCARLDSLAKVGVSTEEATPNPGRTTRRSAATLGDAVRSDLEMEQIIASLGNDELTDPNHLSLRNVAVIPDMISVTHGRVDYLFDDTGHSVANPSEFYGSDTGIHDWTDKEKEIFIDKFAAHPKQFGTIATFLPNKTAAQCVEYYYLHKKSLIDFRRVVLQLAPNKRRRGTRRDGRKGNGLLADIRQHDDEMNRDSSLLVPNGPVTRRKRVIQPTVNDGKKAGSSRRNTAQIEGSPASTPTPEPEARQKRRRTNAISRSNVAAAACQDEGDEDGTVSLDYPFAHMVAHFFKNSSGPRSRASASKERPKESQAKANAKRDCTRRASYGDQIH